MNPKVGLRQKFITKRRALKDEVVTEKSANIARQLLAAIDWTTVRSLHCFLPLEDDNEPDLRAMIEFAVAKGVNVYTSDPSVKTGRDVRILDDEAQQKRVSQYKLTDKRQFDLIIVPMLAYDPASRHRLGFGGGFYDRMLAEQPKARKIGVCFSEFATNLPAESHDIRLDEIIVA